MAKELLAPGFECRVRNVQDHLEKYGAVLHCYTAAFRHTLGVVKLGVSLGKNQEHPLVLLQFIGLCLPVGTLVFLSGTYEIPTNGK